MSDMFWEDDDQPRESNAMRALREKAEADSRKIAELTETVTKLSQEVSATRVEKAVTSKGLPPKVAALAAKAGVGSDPEAVEAFLKEYGDVFAGSTGTEPTGESGDEQPPADDVVPADEQVALAAAAAAARGGQPAVGLKATEDKVRAAQTPEEVLAALGITDL